MESGKKIDAGPCVPPSHDLWGIMCNNEYLSITPVVHGGLGQAWPLRVLLLLAPWGRLSEGDVQMRRNKEMSSVCRACVHATSSRSPRPRRGTFAAAGGQANKKAQHKAHIEFCTSEWAAVHRRQAGSGLPTHPRST